MLSESKNVRVVDAIEKLKELNLKRYWLDNEDFEQFQKVAEFLSSILPKPTDSSLFEIDDILYPNQDITHTYISEGKPEVITSHLLKKCFQCFQNVHYSFFGKKCRICDTAHLQMIEHSPTEILEDKMISLKLCEYYLKNLNHRHGTNLCRSLRVFKVTLSKNRDALENSIKNKNSAIYCYTLYRWLSKLSRISEARSPKNTRMINWIIQQKNVLNQITSNSWNPEFKKLKKHFGRLRKAKKFDVNYIRIVIKYKQTYFKIFYVDQLFDYFSSSQNEEENMRRAKHFLKVLLKRYNCSLEVRVVFNLFKDIISKFNRIFHSKMFLGCEYSDDVMKLVDKYHCNDLEPYITESNIYSTDVNSSNNQQMSEDMNKSLNCQEKPDFTLEKVFIYDEFLKALYVLSKIYQACMMCKNLINLKGSMDRHGDNLRSSCVTEFIKERLFDPSKRGDLPWWFHTMIRKCPFLFVSKHHEHMIDDLIKVLKGEEIDDVKVEKLFFATNQSFYDI